jgi:hypothetical protein
MLLDWSNFNHWLCCKSSFSLLILSLIRLKYPLQGGQKSVIIFSTRQCQPTDSLWFINRRPNLLNVAVSRAQELFILVGNLERISEGGHTKELVEYIKESGEMR